MRLWRVIHGTSDLFTYFPLQKVNAKNLKY